MADDWKPTPPLPGRSVPAQVDSVTIGEPFELRDLLDGALAIKARLDNEREGRADG